MENINIFGYLGAWGGGGSFNNQTGPSWFTSILSFILIYMSKIEAISCYDKNILILKIKKIKLNFFFFFGVMLGPYIKSRGTSATEMSSNAALITMETLCTMRGNNLKASFSYTSQNVKQEASRPNSSAFYLGICRTSIQNWKICSNSHDKLTKSGII